MDLYTQLSNIKGIANYSVETNAENDVDGSDFLARCDEGGEKYIRYDVGGDIMLTPANDRHNIDKHIILTLIA